MCDRLEHARASLAREQDQRREIETRLRTSERLAGLGRLAAGLAHEIGTPLNVISGRAELELEGQKLILEPGDSWLVPPDAEHSYRILEPFTAVEATAPPAQVHGRDAPA